MKLAGALVLLVASVSSGERAKPRVTWADWVGTYDTKLAWHQCSTPGAKSAKLTIEAVDGVMSIDLAPASPGLRAMSLVADDPRQFSAQQGDVSVRLDNIDGHVELAIELDSGCVAKGRMTRVTTGPARCARLFALARVIGAHGCSRWRASRPSARS
jgi:hypothetical protein